MARGAAVRQGRGRSWVGRDERYICHRKGHWAADCPQREDDSGAPIGSLTEPRGRRGHVEREGAIFQRQQIREFVSPEQLHCTAYVSQGPDPECDNEFSAEVKDSLHCSALCWSASRSVISVTLSSAQQRLFLVENSHPHIALSKSPSEEWKDLGLFTLECNSISDWEPTEAEAEKVKVFEIVQSRCRRVKLLIQRHEGGVMLSAQMMTAMELLPLVCLCLLTCSAAASADGNGREELDPEMQTRADTKWIEASTVLMFFSMSRNHKSEFGQLWASRLGVGLMPQGQRAELHQRAARRTAEGEMRPGGRREPVKVIVMEDRDAILPCSLESGENIESRLFDWRKDYQKDGSKDVFMYNNKNQDLSHQSEQFRGRVFHFPDELKNGNASIKITETKLADGGVYTCIFPYPQPERKFNIELVVGAAPEPYVTTLNQTEDGLLLQCFVRGASPKPQLQWQDSDGNLVPAKDPQEEKRGGSYDIILQATVTKTDTYRCVVTQKEINHQTQAETYASVNAWRRWLWLLELMGRGSVKSAARMKAVVVFVEKVEQAKQLVQTGLTVSGTFEPVLPQPATKITLSNVPPLISDAF
ncbi:hypothetical protein L3Q82_007463 [Scortum barcoo]|uniref:Uncharacterized protein n=1 Tax=Scortum barcoo TaxID=214431 RepID=A0ACB8WNL8_9TELE|nr:hypothetical protein L3Q82_007463 [Scortum barcoo]